MVENESVAVYRTRIAALAERTWQFRLAREPHLRVRVGLAVERLPAGGLADAEEAARFARGVLGELAIIDPGALAHEDALTFAFLRDDLCRMAEEPDLWWCQFGVTPYSAMGLSSDLRSVFEPFDFAQPDAADRYLMLAQDYARILDSLRTRLDALASRGWRVPAPALPGVRATLSGLRASALAKIRPATARLAALGPRIGVVAAAINRVLADIEAAFARLLESIGDDYARRAPADVGLRQFPGGEAAYRALVRRHATYDVDPEQIHAKGLSAVEQLRAEMARVRDVIGFRGEESQFQAHLAAAGRLFANTPEEVERRYRYHMSRMASVIGTYFSTTPRAAYDVARLDPALEASLSYGYYEQPTAANPVGRYRYNGSGLESRSQLSAAALIFHELVPGHHFHLARQSENLRLPAIRRESLNITAYLEGWAEYASDLAREMNLYDDPFDLYGRLVLDRFAAQRLVIDTGLNLLGWSLDKARHYMKANTLESDTQIASETLRYSTDLPGQALTYRLGFLKFRELRERAQRALGANWDIRRYHEAVLEAGALPLAVLDMHVNWFIDLERNAHASA